MISVKIGSIGNPATPVSSVAHGAYVAERYVLVRCGWHSRRWRHGWYGSSSSRNSRWWWTGHYKRLDVLASNTVIRTGTFHHLHAFSIKSTMKLTGSNSSMNLHHVFNSSAQGQRSNTPSFTRLRTGRIMWEFETPPWRWSGSLRNTIGHYWRTSDCISYIVPIFLQCFDTVGWVFWPVKTCPRYDL